MKKLSKKQQQIKEYLDFLQFDDHIVYLVVQSNPDTLEMAEKYAHMLVWKEDGQSLQEYRMCRGISLSDIYRLTGVSTSTLSRYEKGEPVKSASRVRKTARLAINYIVMQRKLENELAI